VGSRGLGQVGRFLLGSVAEAVVHNAPCPILLMRGGEDAWLPTQVVFADDGSEEAKGAGELAAGSAGSSGRVESWCAPTRDCPRWMRRHGP
jgi:hypothetical protein